MRARLEKKGLMDTLRNQIIERKVIELIEQHAEFRDVPYTPQKDEVVAVELRRRRRAAARAFPRPSTTKGVNPAHGREDEGLMPKSRMTNVECRNDQCNVLGIRHSIGHLGFGIRHSAARPSGPCWSARE